MCQRIPCRSTETRAQCGTGRGTYRRETKLRVHNQLSARKVATLKEPGKYVDGLGLMLVVEKTGAKRWVVRITVNGKRRDLGLGSALEVPLAEARERRDEIRREIRHGRDPLADKAKARIIPAFADYARAIHTRIKDDFKNPKHAAQWLTSLETYAFPKLANLPVGEIDGPRVREVLEPIWTTKAETARRVKQRIARIVDAAIADGYHSGPNQIPGCTASLAKSKPKARGYAAMPYQDVPAFMLKLGESGMHPASLAAFRLLILTASRTSEVLGADWSEIDLGRRLWTVPAERIKAGREHVVPLSDAAVAVLGSLEGPDLAIPSSLIFPNEKGESFSQMVFLMQLRRMDVPYTAHGFRSSFRDWAEEKTSYSYAAKEGALAHSVVNKVEAAYRRTTLLDERRRLMADWAAFVMGDA